MEDDNFKILVLDGGGSKGVYTLGILYELEQSLGGKLCDHFNLIYGTSTGSIIASLLALGYSVSDIKDLYLKYIPAVMSAFKRKGKSQKLNELGERIFGNLRFTDFKTDVGIVALNYDTQEPLIFKSNINQSHGTQETFIPGFGCEISDAIQASCSAYPVFDFKWVQTKNHGLIKAVDGGFIANNATLFALVDADKAIHNSLEKIKVISIGTGKFVEKPMTGFVNFLRRFRFMKFVERVLTSSTNTNVILTKLLYPDINLVRINDEFPEIEYSTNMVEKDSAKLNKLYQLGRNSYADKEEDINKLLLEPVDSESY